MHAAVAYIYAIPHPYSFQQRAHKDAIPFEGGGANGHWVPFQATQATTNGTKDSTSDEVVLEAGSLKKRFTFSVPLDVSAQNLSMG